MGISGCCICLKKRWIRIFVVDVWIYWFLISVKDEKILIGFKLYIYENKEKVQ